MAVSWLNDSKTAEMSKALIAFFEQSLIGLSSHQHHGGRPTIVGTGTLFRSGNRYAVLTAKHVAEAINKGPHSSIFWPHLSDAIRDAHEGYCPAPEPFDVALILLKREFTPCLEGVTARYVGDISLEDPAQFGKDELFILVGNPWDQRIEEATSTLFVPLHLVTKLKLDCSAELQHKRVLHFELQTDAFRIPNPIECQMPGPHGISGSTVWHLGDVKTKPEEIWNPTKNARIVAVQYGYLPSQRCLHAEPATLWRDWFVQQMNEISTK